MTHGHWLRQRTSSRTGNEFPPRSPHPFDPIQCLHGEAQNCPEHPVIAAARVLIDLQRTRRSTAMVVSFAVREHSFLSSNFVVAIADNVPRYDVKAGCLARGC